MHVLQPRSSRRRAHFLCDCVADLLLEGQFRARNSQVISRSSGGDMRLAIPSEDGFTITPHAEIASGFLVFETRSDQATKVGHRTLNKLHNFPAAEFYAADTATFESGLRNNPGEVSYNKIWSLLKDCQVVISIEMCNGLRRFLSERNIETIFCREDSADYAAREYARGTLALFEVNGFSHFFWGDRRELEL